MTLLDQMNELKRSYLDGKIKWSEYYPKAQKIEELMKAEKKELKEEA